jgi:hypothetical protein
VYDHRGLSCCTSSAADFDVEKFFEELTDEVRDVRVLAHERQMAGRRDRAARLRRGVCVAMMGVGVVQRDGVAPTSCW